MHPCSFLWRSLRVTYVYSLCSGKVNVKVKCISLLDSAHKIFKELNNEQKKYLRRLE